MAWQQHWYQHLPIHRWHGIWSQAWSLLWINPIIVNRIYFEKVEKAFQRNMNRISVSICLLYLLMVPQSSWALCTRHTHTTAWRHVHTVRIAKSLFLSGNSVFAPCKCDNMWIMLVIPSLRRKDFSAVLLPAIVCRWLKTKEYRILYVAHVASEQRLSQTFFDTYYITKQFYPLSAVWHRCGCGKTKCRRITHTHTQIGRRIHWQNDK